MVVQWRGREKRHFLNPLPIVEIERRWTAKFDQTPIRSTPGDERKDWKQGKNNEHRTGRFVTVINASREAVWTALTTDTFTEQYWHGTRARSSWQPGARVDFLVEGDEIGCTGEVLEMRLHEYPILYLVFPAQSRSSAKKRPPGSASDWRRSAMLAAARRRPRLTVVHDQFPEGSRMPEMVGPGWPLVSVRSEDHPRDRNSCRLQFHDIGPSQKTRGFHANLHVHGISGRHQSVIQPSLHCHICSLACAGSGTRPWAVLFLGHKVLNKFQT